MNEGRDGLEIDGNQNVQIQNVGPNSPIQIRIGSDWHEIPLEPAVIPVGESVRSPARLLRARSGVLPLTARDEMLAGLVEWLTAGDAFDVRIVGGRGGSGKTRLAVALAEQVDPEVWASGLLTRSPQEAATEALVRAEAPRLVVIDYAETRVDWLGAVLPRLKARATTEHPVRVLLLVRARLRDSADWRDPLRRPELDAILDAAEVLALEDVPLGPEARGAVWDAAVEAFADRAGDGAERPEPPEVLAGDLFESPLLVVIGAYLGVHDPATTPTTRDALIEELLRHEDRYWEETASAFLDDKVLRRRTVALATLAGARGETEAVELLRLLPDLAPEAAAERRGRIARWLNELYPSGDNWWNPLEPDLVAEHLVAASFTDQPAILQGVLRRDDPTSLVRPLDTFARAAAEHPDLAAALGPVFNEELEALCRVAIEQAATETNLDLLLGEETVAAALDRVLAIVDIHTSSINRIVASLPRRSDLLLSPLALTLTARQVSFMREAACQDPERFRPALAVCLSHLSNRLRDMGRYHEAVPNAAEAVALWRRQVEINPARNEQNLAIALINLSHCLGDIDRDDEALDAARETVAISRRHSDLGSSEQRVRFASGLNALSICLGATGASEAGLEASEEAVALLREVDTSHSPAHRDRLADSLNTLFNRLSELGRHEQALEVIEEAVEMRMHLAQQMPAAYEPKLAVSMTNLAAEYARADQLPRAVEVTESAVAIWRRLVRLNPDAYRRDFLVTLNNLVVMHTELGDIDDAQRFAAEITRLAAPPER